MKNIVLCYEQGGPIMKRLLVLLIVSVIVMATSLPVFAEAVVPEQSVGKVSMNAHEGLHRAHQNVMDNNGNASHVFHIRFMPAFPDHH
jgi:hypothetical protein